MHALDKLATVTYAVQHNPNCPSPYLVRLVGPASGALDLKSYRGGGTRDVLGFGRTLEEAAEAAFQAEHVADTLYWAKLKQQVAPPPREACRPVA